MVRVGGDGAATRQGEGEQSITWICAYAYAARHPKVQSPTPYGLGRVSAMEENVT